jgi:hypothetical protein
MIVMIGKHRFGLVAEIHEELNIPGRAQHGTGIKFVGIGGRPFDFSDQGLPHPLTLTLGTHRKQPNHAHAGHRPEAYRADDRSFRFRHEDMFLPGISPQALEGLRRPATDCVDAGILAERSLLYVEERRKIRLGRWSNVNHDVCPGILRKAFPFIAEGSDIRKGGWSRLVSGRGDASPAFLFQLQN